jgi:hypothetical protein|uniref:Uncharacterized protein n=1 Tax=viral metagenome TaxID=1070528 RepID=A0A6C0HFE0_9ZZZZ
MSIRTALAEAFYRIETLSAAGVTGLNGATGGVNLTSTDSSVTITPNTAAKTVNLSVSATSFPVKTTIYPAGPSGWQTALDNDIAANILSKTRGLILIQPQSGPAVYSSTVFDNVLTSEPFFAYSIMNAAPVSNSGYTLELKTSGTTPIVTIYPQEIVTLVAKGGIAGGDWLVLPGAVLATDLTV